MPSLFSRSHVRIFHAVHPAHQGRERPQREGEDRRQAHGRVRAPPAARARVLAMLALMVVAVPRTRRLVASPRRVALGLLPPGLGCGACAAGVVSGAGGGGAAAVEVLVGVGGDGAAVCRPCREAPLDHGHVCEAEFVEEFACFHRVVALGADHDDASSRVAWNRAFFDLFVEKATRDVFRTLDVSGMEVRAITDVDDHSLLAIFESLGEAIGVRILGEIVAGRDVSAAFIEALWASLHLHFNPLARSAPGVGAKIIGNRVMREMGSPRQRARAEQPGGGSGEGRANGAGNHGPQVASGVRCARGEEDGCQE
eukprot:CAMPEP_0167794808 /NCGR_PEP_ID=MMETSP0111_2-20121227/14024_1 /TAXON_ID=91324 /ORGANISM="Lotharella globosa, Strain CCCM811" /LENGTH=311 /DNA_ID=CAMNT_0007688283 /DNA_START=147 /DNA_END=1082 /DNA_ORIENTATION=+